MRREIGAMMDAAGIAARKVEKGFSTADAAATKSVAARIDMAPVGSSRAAVRGFNASKRASTMPILTK